MGTSLGKFRVPRRVYTEPDAHGHRQLLFAEGREISWDQAIEAGLVDRQDLPAEQVQVILPVNLYEDQPDGSRKLVHRRGSVVSLETATRLGLDMPGPDAGEDDSAADGAKEADVEDAERKDAEPAKTDQAPSPRSPGKGGKTAVRTTEVPGPDK
jgi:hypothetical protein